MARRTHIGSISCGVAQAVGVIGDQWSLMILRDAFLRVRSFEAFSRRLGISPSVLTDRLAKLTDAGLLRREKVDGDGRAVRYHLTEKGRDLYPVMVALMNWGDKWAPSEDGFRVRLVERATGEELRGARVMSAAGTEIGPHDVDVVFGPGADDMLRFGRDGR